MIEPQPEKPLSGQGNAERVVTGLEELVLLVQASGSYSRFAPGLPSDAVLNLGVRFSPIQRDSSNLFYFVIGHLCEATAPDGNVDVPSDAPDSTIGESGSKLLFTAAAEFLLQYRLKPDAQVSDEDLDMFARRNGVFNVQPFWREFLLSSSLRAQLPGVVAPILRLENGSMPPARTRIVSG